MLVIFSTASMSCSSTNLLAANVRCIPLPDLSRIGTRFSIWALKSTMCVSRNLRLGTSKDSSQIILFNLSISEFSQFLFVWRILLNINWVPGWRLQVSLRRSTTIFAKVAALCPYRDRSLTPLDIITLLQMSNSRSNSNTSVNLKLIFLLHRMLPALLPCRPHNPSGVKGKNSKPEEKEQRAQ